MSHSLSRRGFLKGVGVAAGAVAGTRLVGGGHLIGEAKAAGLESPALLMLFLQGGYNSCFNSADSLNTKFGINNDFVTLGNGLAVDKTFASGAQKMSAFALGHMATIGVRHGISAHTSARTADFTDGTHAYYLQLANAMGGTAAIKAALCGSRTPDGPRPMEGTVSLQTITDMKSTISALGGGAPNPRDPERDVTAAGLLGAQGMSSARLAEATTSLTSLREGYSASIDTLKQPVQPFNFATMATAYGKSATATTVSDFTSQIMAAELMITAGANFALAIDSGWDTHGDSSGTVVRNQMNSRILPPLNIFINRMIETATTRNVVVCIMGDFARSLPGSDHQPNVSATVIGKYVKQGTTGKTDGNVGLAPGTPSVPGLWAYLAAVTKTATPPSSFGANPHPLVL